MFQKIKLKIFKNVVYYNFSWHILMVNLRISPIKLFVVFSTGIKDYCERYAAGAVNVQKETFQQIPVLYDTETAMKIEEEFQTTLPVDKLQDRRKWRDGMLAGLAKFKLDARKQEESEK